MNRKEFSNFVASKLNVTQPEGKVIVDTVFDSIIEVLESEGKLSLKGFGNFDVRDTAARTGRNPQTGASVEIAASRKPAWKPAESVREIFKG